MKLNKFFLKIAIVVFFIVVTLIFDFQIIEDLLIPDECVFHFGKPTSKLFDLFYGFPASEGGHPFPTVFHFFFTIFIGGIIGFFVSNRILKNM